MSCGLNLKLDAAVKAAREAFDEAHANDALKDNDLNLLFVYYQGLKKLKDQGHKHSDNDIITFGVEEGLNNKPIDYGVDLSDVTFPDGTYDPDYNITVPTFDDNINLDSISLSQ